MTHPIVTRTVTIGLLALAAVHGHAVHAQAKPEKLSMSVYVTVAPPSVSAEGFVDGSDKILVDSAGDLRKALDGKDFHPRKNYPGSPVRYTCVSDPAKADLVLTIAARGVSAVSLGQRTTMEFYRGVALADTVPTVGITRWVSMILSVGTYRKEFVTWSTNQSRFSAGAWTADAKLLALLAAGWVMANEAQVLERRKARGGISPPIGPDADRDRDG